MFSQGTPFQRKGSENSLWGVFGLDFGVILEAKFAYIFPFGCPGSQNSRHFRSIFSSDIFSAKSDDGMRSMFDGMRSMLEVGGRGGASGGGGGFASELCIEL